VASGGSSATGWRTTPCRSPPTADLRRDEEIRVLELGAAHVGKASTRLLGVEQALLNLGHSLWVLNEDLLPQVIALGNITFLKGLAHTVEQAIITMIAPIGLIAAKQRRPLSKGE